MRPYCIVLILLLITFTLNAQRSKNKFFFGLKAGVVLSQVSYDGQSGFKKKAFVGGGFTRMQLAKNLNAQVEILYIQKGSQQNGNPKINYINAYSIHLWYVEFPLLLQYAYKRWIFEAGPSFGTLVWEREFDNRSGSQAPFVNHFNDRELSMNAGVQFALTPLWAIHFRYSNSVLPIRFKNQYNNVFALTLNRRFKTKQERQKELHREP